MRIGVIGPGAMGCLFAGRLALVERSAPSSHLPTSPSPHLSSSISPSPHLPISPSVPSHQVWLFCRRADDAALIERQGVLIERDGETCRAPVWATASPVQAAPLDLLIILVKSFATAEAIRAAALALGPHSLVLTLQNGLGNDEAIAEVVGRERVLAGVSSQGSTLLGPGRVRHAGFGPSTQADLAGDPAGRPTERAVRVAALLTEAGIPSEAAADVAPLVWGKLVANSALNPITALTGRRNGEVLEEPACLALAEDLARETAAVARALGVRLPFDDPAAHFRAVARQTAANRSSMLQDIERRRPTEVGAINEAIVAAAQRAGLQVPINQTLARLIRERESQYERSAISDQPSAGN